MSRVGSLASSAMLTRSSKPMKAKAKTEAAITPFQPMGGSGADQAATGSAVRPAQLTSSRPVTSITVIAAAKARLSSTPISAMSVSTTPATMMAGSGATGTSAVK